VILPLAPPGLALTRLAPPALGPLAFETPLLAPVLPVAPPARLRLLHPAAIRAAVATTSPGTALLHPAAVLAALTATPAVAVVGVRRREHAQPRHCERGSQSGGSQGRSFPGHGLE